MKKSVLTHATSTLAFSRSSITGVAILEMESVPLRVFIGPVSGSVTHLMSWRNFMVRWPVFHCAILHCPAFGRCANDSEG